MKIATVILVAITILIVVGIPFFRFDVKSGSNVGYISAIDNDFWGNYVVSFRDTEQGGGATYEYYIKKSDKDLAEQARQAMREREQSRGQIRKTYRVLYS